MHDLDNNIHIPKKIYSRSLVQMILSLTLRWMLLFGLRAAPTPGLSGTYRNIYYYYHGIVNAGYGVGVRTSVSGALVKVYLLSSSMRAILTSSRANLIPIQTRGPKPNGMWHS